MKKEIVLNRLQNLLISFAIAALCVARVSVAADQGGEPKVIDPGPVGGPGSDAIVLFDGTDLSKWRSEKGTGEARWILKDGVAIVNGTGSILTKEEFGDCQLHVEWAAPADVKGDGQGRGNSGVYLQGRYEVQVLDCYRNKTYANGMAGALYSKFAPLANVCRKPGEWQIYDIIFHAPKPTPDGQGVVPGSLTVLFNGILVQDHVPVGPATTAAKFGGAVEKGPLMLQDHSNPVRYRNIWIRPL